MLTVQTQNENVALGTCDIAMTSGFPAIRAQQNLLIDLAERCGQTGAMDQLVFLLEAGSLRGKFPHLLIISERDQAPLAAVLIFEYRIGGIPSRIYTPSDFGGERTVIAPNHLRCRVAMRVAGFMLERGALLFLISLSGQYFSSDGTDPLPSTRRNQAFATQTRIIQRTFELGKSYDATLAKFGSHTRRNFRRDARRIAQEFGAVFFEHPEISEPEFLELNRKSAFPVSDRIARWRYGVAGKLPNSIFVGLQSANGQWLSVLGGRRQGDLTDVDWQLNRRGLERYSVSTAMRAYVLQLETDRGTRYLRFDGGTPHSMRLSFMKEPITDLLFFPSLHCKAMLFKLLPNILPEGNSLALVMVSKSWTWHVSAADSESTG
jgi:hypothetical protein